jgi:hypothetical protein
VQADFSVTVYTAHDNPAYPESLETENLKVYRLPLNYRDFDIDKKFFKENQRHHMSYISKI